MVLTFTLRMLGVAVAVIAVALWALLNPTPNVATAIVNGVLCLLLVAGCLAAGTRQPARSFWLGLLWACLGTLAIDELDRRNMIRSPVFPQPLASMIEEALPPIPDMRGEPGTTVYYQSSSRFPLYFYSFGEDGTPASHGFMRMDEALLEEIGPLENLPHLKNVPRSHERSTICRYLLASFIGLLGGILSYAMRRRADRRLAT
ncbi:MAG: hypothetical protein KY475_02990 [Planctomycetes bacterium]|nr:hypothetical protein [Planctomycetota bacterium]